MDRTALSPILDCKCGRGRCPKIELTEDRSIVVRDNGQRIAFDEKQTKMLAEWLVGHGFLET